jgi:arginine exporter protein ArgO
VKIARETWLLGLFCMLDMLSTAWLIHKGLAREANPVMGFYVDRSLPVFVMVKSLMFIAPLTVLELLRRRNPVFVRNMLRAGILAYLLVYGVGAFRTNADKGSANALVSRTSQSLPN